MNLSDHPRLLFDARGLEALRARIEKQDWVRENWAHEKGELEAVLALEVVLPPRGGNWFHWYASPTTGTQLRTGKQIGDWAWEHEDPVSGEILRGDPSEPSRDYDGCVIRVIHYDWCERVRRLGVAYGITGEARYAAKVREILMAYAAKYLQYPLHNTRGEAKIGGGRVGAQTLNEAVWTIPMCQGADLIWDVLSDADRAVLANDMFQPAAREVILPHEMKVHNIQCWKNSAVGLVGFLLGDEELIQQAIDHPERGYHKQMAEGVSPDGQWWEGAWGYHFYTLSALWPLVEAARNCGMNLYGDALKRMFDGPLKFAMPNLKLPAFNDSGEVNLAGQAPLYELGYARYATWRGGAQMGLWPQAPLYELGYAHYGDTEYMALLAHTDRRDEMALWFGVDVVSKPAGRTWQSINYPDSGYAVLARGEGTGATWLCLKYGPHGGGHGHPDKLNFVLASQGDVIGIDPGTARYGLPVQRGWYKTTFAHNVLTVDESAQEQAEGKCLAFGTVQGVDYCSAEAGGIYEGVRHVRTVALVDEHLIVFIDQVTCDRERVLDIGYHQRGAWTSVPDGKPWAPPDKDGYRYLRDASIRSLNGTALGLAVREGFSTSVALAGGVETEVITATGVGHHSEDRVPVVVFRRRAKASFFAWCVAINADAPALQVSAGDEAVVVQVGKRAMTVHHDGRFEARG